VSYRQTELIKETRASMEVHLKGLYDLSTKVKGNIVLQNKKYDALEQKIDDISILKIGIKALNSKLDHLLHLINEGKEIKMGKRKINNSTGPFGKEMVNHTSKDDNT